MDETLETKEVKQAPPPMELHPATKLFRERQSPPPAESKKVETVNEALLLALEMMEAQLQIAAQSLESQAKLCRLVIEKCKQA